MVRKIIMLNIEGCVHEDREHILCDECFNSITKNVDFSDIEEPPWKDPFDSRYPTEPERVYHVGIYIKIIDEYDEDFCSACGIHRGFKDTNTGLLRGRIGIKLAEHIRMYRIYRKLMEFIPKEEIDKMIDSVYTSTPLTPEESARWSAWCDAHPYD